MIDSTAISQPMLGADVVSTPPAWGHAPVIEPLAAAKRVPLARVAQLLNPIREKAAAAAGRIAGATPGCYHEPMSSEAYHRTAPGISSTSLKAMLRSPAHYVAAKLDDSDSAALALGRAAHCLLLEPATFDQEFAVWDGGRRQGGEWKDFQERNAAKDILTAEERDTAQRIAQAALDAPCFPTRRFLEGVKGPDGAWRLEPARTEFSVFWTDEETGIQLKVRFDAVAALILDLKTCQDATPAAFGRDAYKFHYDLSAALYVEGARRFFGAERPFGFLAVEKDQPHGVWLHDADHEFLEHGRRKLRAAITRYAECLQTGKWPAYGAEARSEIGPPPRWLAFGG